MINSDSQRRTSLWSEEDGRKTSGASRWAFVNLALCYVNSNHLTKFQRKQSRNSNGMVIRLTVALRLRSAIVGYSFRISINAELNHVLILGIIAAYVHKLNVSVKVELIHARDVDSENSREKIEVAVFPFDPDVEGGIS